MVSTLRFSVRAIFFSFLATCILFPSVVQGQSEDSAAPAEPSTHFLLAQAYRALGRTQEAQAEMKVFSKLEEAERAKTAEGAKEVLQEKSKEP